MAKRKNGKRTKAPAKARELPKVATGIEGLDSILNGGLPIDRLTLVSGGPGCGKSVLGLEFVYRGLQAGEPGIFVSFEEQAAAVRQNALTFGWDLAPFERAGKLFLMEAHVDPQAVLSGDFSLRGLTAIIGGQAKAMGAKRIVIDAIDVLMRIFDDPARERNELYILHDWLIEHELTTILTVKTRQDLNAGSYDFLDFMADCVIFLDQRVTQQVTTRRLRVIKYRGSDAGRNEYPFVITNRGIRTIPISTAGLRHRPLGATVSSGHPRLDAMLGGGLRRNSCVLFSGAPGTGKTTLACTFVRTACQRGEKVLYVSFEESPEAVVGSMLSPGIDLRRPVKSGLLSFVTTIPEAMGPDEHLFRVLDAMERFQPDTVVMEAISSCQRMGPGRVAFEYVMRLANACKEQDRTLILTNQVTGFQESHEITGVNLSSLIDTVLLLRYVEIGGEVNRVILVMKARGMKHSNQYREFLITDKGIDITDVYVEKGGVLTGTARQEREAQDAIDSRRKQQELEEKERDVAQLRAALEAQTQTLRAQLEAAETQLESLRQEQQFAQAARQQRAKIRGRDAPADRAKTPRRPGAGRKGGAK